MSRSRRDDGPHLGRRRVLALGALAGVSLAAACSRAASGGAGGSSASGAGAPAKAAPQISVTPADGAAAVRPTDPVVVRVDQGTFESVTLTGPDGAPVAGQLNPERTEWRSGAPLAYGQRYAVAARATGEGAPAEHASAFTVLNPALMTAAYTITGQGGTYGIGQPVAVVFDEKIPDRQAAQDAITVRTEPPVEGAFYWVSPKEVRWRPEKFWAPGTKVDVAIDIFGKDLGGGTFGQENAHSAFAIGDAVISRVDDDNKVIVVERNGQVERRIPTSMGKPSDPTPNGIYYVGDKQPSMIMDSETYGVSNTSANGYKTRVQFATQMSYSGIYVHSAPWSVWAQGSQDTSHGCLNVSPTNAEWFFDQATRGDVVIVSGTSGGTLPGTDGLGDWNIPWETWKAGNAHSM